MYPEGPLRLLVIFIISLFIGFTLRVSLPKSHTHIYWRWCRACFWLKINQFIKKKGRRRAVNSHKTIFQHLDSCDSSANTPSHTFKHEMRKVLIAIQNKKNYRSSKEMFVLKQRNMAICFIWILISFKPLSQFLFSTMLECVSRSVWPCGEGEGARKSSV